MNRTAERIAKMKNLGIAASLCSHKPSTTAQMTARTAPVAVSNCRVAYAMLKTGGYVDLPEDSLPEKLSEFERKFAAAQEVYGSMTSDQQWHWSESVQRRYPRLVDVVEAIR